jgi:hypothetical protein
MKLSEALRSWQKPAPIPGVRRFLSGLLLCALIVPVAAHEQHGGNRGAPVATTSTFQERIATAVGATASVAADESGRLWLARMEKGHVWISRSDDGGKSFSSAVKVNAEPEAILADGQNRPKVVAGGGVIAVTWAQGLAKPRTGHVRFARSVDGGLSFSPPLTVNDDRQEIGHSFPTLVMNDQGQIALVWLDGRKKAAQARAGVKHLGSSICYVLSDDRGETFSPNTMLADHSCECCRIGLAFAPSGEAVAHWRHVFGDNIRDFGMAPLQLGATVVRASYDDWQVAACPHHGGDLSIDEGGRSHLVWFTGSAKGPGIYYRHANGENLSTPVALGNRDAQAGNPAVFARDGQVWLAWREFDGKQYRVMTQYSRDRGDNWATATELANATGAADLPLFVAGTVKPLLAWYTGGSVRIFDLGATK